MSDEMRDKLLEKFFKEHKRDRRFRYFKTFIFLIVVGIFVSFSYFTPNSFKSQGSLRQSNISPDKLYRTFTLDETKEGSATIFVIPIDGGIVGTENEPLWDKNAKRQAPFNTVAYIKTALSQAESHKNLTTVVLSIQSPGGTADASGEIYRMLKNWKKKTGVRLVAHVRQYAASGGYYIAQAADEIVAGPHSVVGSIGVILRLTNYHKFYDYVGLKEETFVTGPYKDTGSPTRPMRQDEKHYFQKDVEKRLEDFIEAVANGRDHVMSPDQVRTLANGKVFRGQDALEKGLIDRIAIFDMMLAQEAEISQSGTIGKIEVFTCTQIKNQKKPFLSFLLDAVGLSVPSENKMPTRVPLYFWRNYPEM